jgi:hypothetical protein
VRETKCLAFVKKIEVVYKRRRGVTLEEEGGYFRGGGGYFRGFCGQ